MNLAGRLIFRAAMAFGAFMDLGRVERFARRNSRSKFEIKRPFGRLWAPCVVTAAALAFIGCGGSGGGGGGGGYSARQTIRATALSTYQSMAALTVYPIAALETSAPANSDITAPPNAIAATSTTPTLTLVHHTGLYTTGPEKTTTGAVYRYFTTAAGTTSAGSMTVDSSTGSFTYSKYPATVSVAVDVTAGDIPCAGKASIVYQNASGACEISGTLQLVKNKETVTFDLVLSSSHQVTGSFQIAQNGITFGTNNLSGPLVGDQSYSFGMNPSGYSGNGTIDLISPTITLLFSHPKGVSASIDSSHHLVIHYGTLSGGGGIGTTGDGDDEDIVDPIIQLLFGGDDSTDSTDGSTTDSTTDGSTTTGSSSGDTTTSTDSGDCSDVAKKPTTVKVPSSPVKLR